MYSMVQYKGISKHRAFRYNEFLERYMKWSGQQLNVAKSSLVFSKNIEPWMREEIGRVFQFREMKKDEVFLGNPLFLSSSRVQDFKLISEKVHAKLKGWRCKLLFRVGRTTFIKSIIQAIPLLHVYFQYRYFHL